MNESGCVCVCAFRGSLCHSSCFNPLLHVVLVPAVSYEGFFLSSCLIIAQNAHLLCCVINVNVLSVLHMDSSYKAIVSGYVFILGETRNTPYCPKISVTPPNDLIKGVLITSLATDV